MTDPIMYKEIWNDMTPLGRCVLFLPAVLLAYSLMILFVLSFPFLWLLIKLDKPIDRILNIKRLFFKGETL